MIHFIKRKWEKILNIIRWLPIIWNDYDWDYAFIYDALRHKLDRTAAYLEKKKRFENYELVVRDIRICVKLIDLVHDGYYECEYQNYLHPKYPR